MSADKQQAKGKRGGLRRTSWKPGMPSPNPGGRPRSSYECAEKIRAANLSEDWIAFELDKARDPNLPIAVRTDAWRALIDRGYSKPAADLNVNPGSDEPAPDLSAFTTEELAVWLALHEKATAADPRSTEASRADDERTQDTASRTPIASNHVEPHTP